MQKHWREVDKARVRKIIDHVVKKCSPSTLGALAEAVGAAGRAVVFDWRKRGCIPLRYHEKVIALARPEMDVSPDQLNLQAKFAMNAAAAGERHVQRR